MVGKCRDVSTPNAKYIYLYVPRNGIQFLKDIKHLRNTSDLLVTVMETYIVLLNYTSKGRVSNRLKDSRKWDVFKFMFMHGNNRK